MLTITLMRMGDSPDGTPGMLYMGGDLESVAPTFVTFEEEEAGNASNRSRVPPGLYLCKRTVYMKHNVETYDVTGVPGRNRILFHWGNTEEDTQGCILLGTAFGRLRVQDEETGKRRLKLAVLYSLHAFKAFMRKLDSAPEFLLRIVDPGQTVEE